MLRCRWLLSKSIWTIKEWFNDAEQWIMLNLVKQQFRDLHLEDIEDVSEITPKLLVKRATDAIVFKEDNVKDADWQFSYVH